MNLVVLKGNLTRDPELRYTQTGRPVTTMSIAVNKRYTTKDGEKKEQTDFFKITVWGAQAESCAQYLSKGRPILLHGALKQSQWETEQGEKRSSVEVVANSVEFLSSGQRKTEDTADETTTGEEAPF